MALNVLTIFIHWICENTFFIKIGIINYTKDGCRKQYKFANEMWLLSVLEFTHRVIIGRCINDPGCGKSKIDGINVSNKIYLKQKMCMIGTEESNNKSMIINAYLIMCDKNK